MLLRPGPHNERCTNHCVGNQDMRFKIALAALAATAAFASPAVAQTVASESATARGTVLQPLTLTEDSDLDFGTVLSTAAAGTVTINANSGVRSVTGGVAAV